jgi:hypothetical protein
MALESEVAQAAHQNAADRLGIVDDEGVHAIRLRRGRAMGDIPQALSGMQVGRQEFENIPAGCGKNERTRSPGNAFA